jgi:hypothetical protein
MDITRVEGESVDLMAYAGRSEEGTARLDGHQFTDCSIRCSKPIRLREKVEFVGVNDLSGGRPMSEVLEVVPENEGFPGALEVSNCIFASCRFENVQIVASADHPVVRGARS